MKTELPEGARYARPEDPTIAGRLLRFLLSSCSPLLPFPYDWRVHENLAGSACGIVLWTCHGNGQVKAWQCSTGAPFVVTRGPILGAPRPAPSGAQETAYLAHGVELEMRWTAGEEIVEVAVKLNRRELEHMLESMVNVHASWRLR